MIRFEIEKKKGTFIGQGKYHREVKLFSSSKSEISTEKFALGMTIIEPGQWHEEHEHDANQEIMLIYEGTGILTSNGEEFQVKKGDIFSFEYNEAHGFRNTGTTALKILWIYHPPGVAEEKFLVRE